MDKTTLNTAFCRFSGQSFFQLTPANAGHKCILAIKNFGWQKVLFLFIAILCSLSLFIQEGRADCPTIDNNSAAEEPRSIRREWVRIYPSITPSARHRHAMIFDPSSERTLLYGGVGNNGKALTDTWLWDGKRWEKAATTRKPAPSRNGHISLAYDEKHKNVVMFQGEGTWLWDGVNWEHVTYNKGPRNLLEHAMGYDCEKGRLLMFGGEKADANQYTKAKHKYNNNTWEWKGREWVKLNTKDAPSPRSYHVLVKDPIKGYLWIMGGSGPKGWFDSMEYLDDMWKFTMNGWMKSAARLPIGLIGFSVVSDIDTRRLILFGGANESGWPVRGKAYQGTWEWNGKEWVKSRVEKNPPPLYSHAMSYDPPRKRIVLFGGLTPDRALAADTWELAIAQKKNK